MDRTRDDARPCSPRRRRELSRLHDEIERLSGQVTRDDVTEGARRRPQTRNDALELSLADERPLLRRAGGAPRARDARDALMRTARPRGGRGDRPPRVGLCNVARRCRRRRARSNSPPPRDRGGWLDGERGRRAASPAAALANARHVSLTSAGRASRGARPAGCRPGDAQRRGVAGDGGAMLRSRATTAQVGAAELLLLTRRSRGSRRAAARCASTPLLATACGGRGATRCAPSALKSRSASPRRCQGPVARPRTSTAHLVPLPTTAAALDGGGGTIARAPPSRRATSAGRAAGRRRRRWSGERTW